MPKRVNLAKVKLLLGEKYEVAENAKMYTSGVAQVLVAHKDRMLATADLIIKDLQSFADPPPSSASHLEDNGETQAEEKAQSATSTGKRPSNDGTLEQSEGSDSPRLGTAPANDAALNANAEQSAWTNPFSAPIGYSKGPDVRWQTALDFEFAAPAGVSKAWRRALENRVDDVIKR